MGFLAVPKKSGKGAEQLARSYPQVATTLIVIIILVIVFKVGKAKGSTGKPKRIKESQLPNSGEGIPKGWTPSDLSDRLYENFTGGLFGYRMGFVYNDELYKELVDLETNDMLAAVYHDFTNRYGKKDSSLPNLRAWIESESYVKSFKYPFRNFKEELLTRLRTIGL